jgi:hypothetical protein
MDATACALYTYLVQYFYLRLSTTRLTRLYEDNIKMDLKEKIWEIVVWFYLLGNMNQWLALVSMS